MRAILVALLLLAGAPAQGAAQKAAHWQAELPRGPYAVRLDTVHLRDSTRKFRFERGGAVTPGDRPIRISIWRPAAQDSRPTLTYGQYAELVGFEGRDRVDSASSAAAQGRREMLEYLVSLGADPARATLALELPMLARYGAPRAAGRFPLVLLAVGKDDSPVLHAVAAEYLASHGFVVVGSNGLGAEARAMQWSTADLEAQATDLTCVLAWARTDPGIDAGRVGILAFSFGSGPALIAARRDSSIAAIVSLDGSIGFADRVPMHRTLPDLRGDTLAVPVLHANIAGIPRNDLALLREITSDLTIVGFAGAGHLDFTALASVTAGVPGLTIARLGDDTWADPANVHAAVIMLARDFLEARLSSLR